METTCAMNENSFEEEEMCRSAMHSPMGVESWIANTSTCIVGVHQVAVKAASNISSLAFSGGFKTAKGYIVL